MRKMSDAGQEGKASRVDTVGRVYLIIALFTAIILCLAFLVQVQMDTLNAIRAYIGGESLWARAQKDAILSLERYVVSRDEADYQAYHRLIQVTLGDKKARIELQKPDFDPNVARDGFVQGRNHPADVPYAIDFFRRFQHTRYMSQAIAHWTEGDRLIAELDQVARSIHDEVVSGRPSAQSLRTLHARLEQLNLQMSNEEDRFSSTLAEGSRWASDLVRKLTYAIVLLFMLLGVAISWPIVSRIRATESALSESEQKFRSITTSAMDAIAMIDDQGKVVFFNRAAEKMFGFPAEEVLGKDLHQLFSPVRYMDDYRRAFPHFAKTGEGAAMGKLLELGALRRDGSEFPIELTVSAISIKGRWNAVGIIRDVTERKAGENKIRELNETLQAKVQERTQQLLEAQAELVRKEKLAVLGQVAGSVGHELRNPLGVMSNAVYYLESVLPEAKENVREYLDLIKSEITGAERIVSELLDSVRTNPPRTAAVTVTELIKHSLRRCKVPPSISVGSDIPAALPRLRVDAQQMEQVFRNLINNAVGAMPEGGVIRISAIENKSGGSVTISVRDNGVGMTAEQLSRAFQPLYTTKARGIGLGLVVVKNLTEANGGRVEVESEPGKGTVFSITLPSETHGGRSA